jgi:hypothetical protein
MPDIQNGPTLVLSVDVSLPAPIRVSATNAVEQAANRDEEPREVDAKTIENMESDQNEDKPS